MCQKAGQDLGIQLGTKSNTDYTELGPIPLLPKFSFDTFVSRAFKILFLSFPQCKAKVEQGPWTKSPGPPACLTIRWPYNTNGQSVLWISEAVVGRPVSTQLRWWSQASLSSAVLQKEIFFLTYFFPNCVLNLQFISHVNTIKKGVSEVTVKCLGMLELHTWKQKNWIAWHPLK